MATLDFVYDLKEKMDDENMEYVLLIVQHGAEESNVNAFYSIDKDTSADMLCAATKQICESIGADETGSDLQILSIEEDEDIQEDNDWQDDDKDEEEEK